MILKINNPTDVAGGLSYNAYNVSSNMEKFLSIVDNVTVNVGENAIHWSVPYKIIDISKPHIIKTKQSTLSAGSLYSPTSNYAKEVNTLTNTTTYTGTTSVYRNYLSILNDMEIKATLYPNKTGVVETIATARSY